MSYVYRKVTTASGKDEYQVGYHRPTDSSGAGGWYSVEKFQDAEVAAWRVHFLNGGSILPNPSVKSQTPTKAPGQG